MVSLLTQGDIRKWASTFRVGEDLLAVYLPMMEEMMLYVKDFADYRVLLKEKCDAMKMKFERRMITQGVCVIEIDGVPYFGQGSNKVEAFKEASFLAYSTLFLPHSAAPQGKRDKIDAGATDTHVYDTVDVTGDSARVLGPDGFRPDGSQFRYMGGSVVTNLRQITRQLRQTERFFEPNDYRWLQEYDDIPVHRIMQTLFTFVTGGSRVAVYPNDWEIITEIVDLGTPQYAGMNSMPLAQPLRQFELPMQSAQHMYVIRAPKRPYGIQNGPTRYRLWVGMADDGSYGGLHQAEPRQVLTGLIDPYYTDFYRMEF